ncbi:MAG: carboxypeptidase regulatory-like domain-containing protein [Gemmatimonadales bacterium]
MRRSKRLALIAVLVGSTTPVATAHAQAKSAALIGTIRDAGGRPVDNADVSVASMNALARTDSLGRFRLQKLDPGPVTVAVRRLGFEAESFDFTLHAMTDDSVAVILQPNVQLLDAMKTDAALSHRFAALQEFYQRRTRGTGGSFLTRADIERRNTTILSEVLRNVPGVRILRAGGTEAGGVRFASSSTRSQVCMPNVWIDGQLARNTEVDDIPANDVEAMELYPGPSTTPMQFSQQATSYACGAVVIWTRLPGVP